MLAWPIKNVTHLNDSAGKKRVSPMYFLLKGDEKLIRFIFSQREIQTLRIFNSRVKNRKYKASSLSFVYRLLQTSLTTDNDER